MACYGVRAFGGQSWSAEGESHTAATSLCYGPTGDHVLSDNFYLSLEFLKEEVPWTMRDHQDARRSCVEVALEVALGAERAACSGPLDFPWNI